MKFQWILVSMIMAFCFVQPCQAAEEECNMEELFMIFPENFVAMTLSKHKVEPEKRTAVAKDLSSKDRVIFELMEKKANGMTPNPLTDRSQRAKAEELFSETVYEVFSQVMNQHGMNDKKQNKEMLVEIQEMRSERLEKCRPMIEKELQKRAQQQVPR